MPHITLAPEPMYLADKEMKKEKRKEEGEKRRLLNVMNRDYEELMNNCHIRKTSSRFYNIINGKVANASVNV